MQDLISARKLKIYIPEFRNSNKVIAPHVRPVIIAGSRRLPCRSLTVNVLRRYGGEKRVELRPKLV